jgi:uncharacterized protein DUF222
METARILTPSEVLDRARTARSIEQTAAFEQLAMALEWARLHPCPPDERPAGWGDVDLHGEGIVPLAGAGAPWVAEFAPADLAAALGQSLDQAKALMGDALELRHRLPRLWDLAEAGRIPVWRARLVACLTKDLSREAALFADRLIAATPERITKVAATRLVQEARLFFDPDRAIDDEERAAAARGVQVRRGGAPGTSQVEMILDTPDADDFDSAIGRIAEVLKRRGDTDHLDVRRARAAGILADPQRALELLCGREAGRTRGSGGEVSLYVHLTTDDVEADRDGGTGVAVVERLGAMTTRLLADWLARYAEAGTRITLRPVIDLGDENDPAHLPVDRHDPPAAMREVVTLRDAHCVFPGCTRDSRFCDLDHITEYLPIEDGGPPGQTHPGNLAPLCRTHHRVKTHTAWHYKRLDDGSYEWFSPTGHQHTVTPCSR